MSAATPVGPDLPAPPSRPVSPIARPARLLLWLVLVLCVVLRAGALDWCIEGTRHFKFSLHPDENRKVAAAFSLKPTREGLRPSAWVMGKGTLLPPLGRLWYEAVARSPLAAALPRLAGAGIESAPGRFLVLRSFSAACSVLLAWLVFRLGIQLTGSGYAGVLAAFFSVTSFSGESAAVIFKSDMLLATLVAALLVGTAGYAAAPSPRRAALLGVVLGLAVAAKYLGAIAAVAPVTAMALVALPIRRRVQHVALFAVAALAALFAASPYMFLDPALLRASLANTTAINATRSYHFEGHGPRATAVLTHVLVPGLGPTLTALSVAGLAHACLRAFRHGERLLHLPLVAFVAAMYLAISLQAWLVARYTIPLVPVLAALAAAVTWRALVALRSVRRPLAWAGTALLALLVVEHSVRFAAFHRLLAEPATTVRASRWLFKNLDPRCSVVEVRRRGPVVYGFGRDPVPELTAPWIDRMVEEGGSLSGVDADYLVVTEQVFRDFFRLADDERYAGHRRLYAELFDPSRFRTVRSFQARPRALGIEFPRGTLPEDLLLISPDTFIFRRVASPSGCPPDEAGDVAFPE